MSPIEAQPGTAPPEPAALRYLEGNYAPVRDEILATDLVVTGVIPDGLEGMLLRNGPNPVADGGPRHHWFTGSGMIHAIELGGGAARSYRNRWVRTAATADELGQPDPGGPVDVMPAGGSAANTNIVGHAGRLLALVENGLPHEVTPELETVGRFDFDGRLRTPMTAHPKVDPVTGEMHFFGYSVLEPPHLTYHVAGPDGVLTSSEPVDGAGPSMYHDFAMTETRVAFFDLPCAFDLELAMGGWFPFSWQPDHEPRIGVLDRGAPGSDVRWIACQPCYVYHPFNAYDDGDRMIIDVVQYARMFDRSRHGPFDDGEPSVHRWTIDIVAGTFGDELIAEGAVEFPRIDERRIGRRHSLGYALTLEPSESGLDFGRRIARLDLDRGIVVHHDLGAGRRGSEPVFVPDPASTAEDEGWLLVVTYDENTNTSALLVLDASDLGTKASVLATVQLPQRVPFGFHGNWIPGSR